MKAKERLTYYLYLALLYPLALLPLRALHFISDVVLYPLIYKVAKYRLKMVRKNISESFPEMTPEQQLEVERDFYHQLCDNIVETVKLLHMPQREVDRRIVTVNGDLVSRLAERGKPIMLMLGHYGNWEWMTALSYSYPRDIYSAHIYKALHNKAADKLMKKVRGRFISRGIEFHKAVRTILQLFQEHSRIVVGFISDHRITDDHHIQSTMFLNHDTHFYVGAEGLGSKVDASYLYLDVERTGRGRYRQTFVEIIPDKEDLDKPYPITRKYHKLLEQTIRRRPGLWLWSHNRWKKC